MGTQGDEPAMKRGVAPLRVLIKDVLKCWRWSRYAHNFARRGSERC
jgi:hypothetical protein